MSCFCGFQFCLFCGAEWQTGHICEGSRADEQARLHAGEFNFDDDMVQVHVDFDHEDDFADDEMDEAESSADDDEPVNDEMDEDDSSADDDELVNDEMDEAESSADDDEPVNDEMDEADSSADDEPVNDENLDPLAEDVQDFEMDEDVLMADDDLDEPIHDEPIQEQQGLLTIEEQLSEAKRDLIFNALLYETYFNNMDRADLENVVDIRVTLGHVIEDQNLLPEAAELITQRVRRLIYRLDHEEFETPLLTADERNDNLEYLAEHFYGPLGVMNYVEQPL
jgi:hypothetical protein